METRMISPAVVLLILVVSTTTAVLEKYPHDLNATVGQNVTLPCKTSLDYTVYWYFNGEEIFYGGKVSMSFQNKFKVESREKGEYNLIISSADESYTGVYECGDDEGQGERRSARLYVTAATVTVAAMGGATDGDVSTGTIIGIVIAIIVVLVLAILILVAVCLCRRRARGREQKRVGNPDAEGQQSKGPEKDGTAAGPTSNVRGPLINHKPAAAVGDGVDTANLPKASERIKKLEEKLTLENNYGGMPISKIGASRPLMGATTQDDAELTASNAAPSDTEATSEDSGVGHNELGFSAVDIKHGASSRPITPTNDEFRANAGSPDSVAKQKEHNTTSSNESKVADEDTRAAFSATGSPEGAQSSTPFVVSKTDKSVSPIQKEDESNHQGEKPKLPPKPGTKQ